MGHKPSAIVSPFEVGKLVVLKRTMPPPPEGKRKQKLIYRQRIPEAIKGLAIFDQIVILTLKSQIITVKIAKVASGFYRIFCTPESDIAGWLSVDPLSAVEHYPFPFLLCGHTLI